MTFFQDRKNVKSLIKTEQMFTRCYHRMPTITEGIPMINKQIECQTLSMSIFCLSRPSLSCRATSYTSELGWESREPDSDDIEPMTDPTHTIKKMMSQNQHTTN